jgi:segregation and condensation protein B
MQEVEARAIVEAALLTAQRPLTFRELQTLVGESVDRDALKAALEALRLDWQGRASLSLLETAAGWRFATSPAVRPFLEPLHAERPQRYSRAVMETLAVIAYRQPVTRGDIEDIRGVVIGSPIIKQLEDRGWIDCIGHRDAPGRPALYATTKQFLDDLGLATLIDLPPLEGPDGSLVLPELPAQGSLLSEVDSDLISMTELPAEPEDKAVMDDALPCAEGLGEVLELDAGDESAVGLAASDDGTGQAPSESAAQIDSSLLVESTQSPQIPDEPSVP